MLDTAERSRTRYRPSAVCALRHRATSARILLQSMLASFQASDPCSVDLWIGPNPDVAERLANGTADVALMEWWSERPGFCGYTWRKEPLGVIVGPGHPWAAAERDRGKRTGKPDLFGGRSGNGNNHASEKGAWGHLAEGLTAIGGFGNTEAVKRAVRAGRGVSLVIAAAVADEVKAGQLVALRIKGIELVKELKIISPIGLPDAAPAARFVAHVLGDAC